MDVDNGEKCRPQENILCQFFKDSLPKNISSSQSCNYVAIFTENKLILRNLKWSYFTVGMVLFSNIEIVYCIPPCLLDRVLTSRLRLRVCPWAIGLDRSLALDSFALSKSEIAWFESLSTKSSLIHRRYLLICPCFLCLGPFLPPEGHSCLLAKLTCFTTI